MSWLMVHLETGDGGDGEKMDTQFSHTHTCTHIHTYLSFFKCPFSSSLLFNLISREVHKKPKVKAVKKDLTVFDKFILIISFKVNQLKSGLCKTICLDSPVVVVVGWCSYVCLVLYIIFLDIYVEY